MRYALIFYEEYYPDGGESDFAGVYENFDEACSEYETILEEILKECSSSYFLRIYDMEESVRYKDTYIRDGKMFTPNE